MSNSFTFSAKNSEQVVTPLSISDEKVVSPPPVNVGDVEVPSSTSIGALVSSLGGVSIGVPISTGLSLI